MSTLANTTWSVAISGEAACEVSVVFNETGTAYIMFPNKTASTAEWEENVDGSFVFQLSRIANNPNMVEVFFGTYNDEKGKGHWNGLNNSRGSFTMIKQQ